MRKLLVVLLIVCTVVPAGSGRAQDETPGWPVERRCVEPSRAPAGWTYPGVILIKGWAGLHGVSASWATPHVLAYMNNQGWLPGSLLPDGRWYAVPQMDWWDREPYAPTYRMIVNQINVYSTVEAVDSVFLPWHLYDIQTMGDAFLVVRWRDDEHFIYAGDTEGADGLVLVDPALGEITPWEETGYEVLEEYFFPSPDWTRGVLIKYGSLMTVSDIATGDEISRLDLDETPSRVYQASWSPRSDSFVAHVSTSDKSSSNPYSKKLVWYDPDGNLKAIMAHFSFSNSDVWLSDMQWSSDGRYVAFGIFQNREDGRLVGEIYLADTDQRRILDTCLSLPPGTAWSPTGALLAAIDDDGKVQVLDVERWQLYTAAYHDGGVIGWRE